MRCATVIENVLKMMKAPTNTAAPANASRSGVKKPLIELVMSLLEVCAFSAPVWTRDVPAHRLLDAVLELGRA